MQASGRARPLVVERRSVSTVVVALTLAVVLVVAGAGYYVISRTGGSTVGTVTNSSTTRTATSSFLNTSITSSSSAGKGAIILSFGASPPLASADVNVTYPVKISALGSVPSTISLNATITHG